MRIKLDENLPASLRSTLSRMGHDVDTVMSEGLSGRDDDAVWDRVVREDRFLITQDLDFSDIRRFAPGSHPGILLIRLREPGRKALSERVAGLFACERVDAWRRGFVVATDHKLRVRLPS